MKKVIIIALAIISLASCATQKQNHYQSHLRNTPTKNWVKQDNGGCGWSR
jgi:hypothetical protein